MKLHADGRLTVVAKDIDHPVGLAVDRWGGIWVGAADPGEQEATGTLGEAFNTRILRFTPGEQPQEVVKLDDGRRHAFTFFDVDGEGNLYLPDGNRLLLRTQEGEIHVLAEGFSSLRGAVVCRDGSIVVTDYGTAAAYRLRKR